MTAKPSSLPPLTDQGALFLDFDGTLAPIQDDPETVALPKGGGDLLEGLAHRLRGALVVISGRDIRDLSKRVPHTLWRAGGHGLETCAPGEAPGSEPPAGPIAVAKSLAGIVAEHPGTRLEPKGAVFAIHYRAAPQQGPSLQAALAPIASETEDYKLQSGKMVFELKPTAANKGKALARIMALPDFAGRTPIMVGDDTTDEDAMTVAAQLGGHGIKVGAGDTVAHHRVDAPEDVFAWLKECA